MSPIDTGPIDAAAANSELIARALAKAAEAHAGQIRNGSGGLPYLEHPRMVAATLAARGYGEETLAAALLHDVVEDSDTTVDDLRAEFGDEIAALVAALSDDESIDSYRDRKDEHRGRVADVDGDALAIYAADKLTNMTTLHAAIEAEGMRVAEEYEVPIELKLEVWEADAAMLRDEAPELALLDPLDLAISRLGADLGAAAPPPCT
ncbi:MAG TPA: HD domain-containing protein [Solirubrobacterales bacterium]|nr:HD domain-containing protein [Solirubrobacterales bacterium]